jgi:uncharacterized protein
MNAQDERKLAVVTGASSGIGLELARQCVEHGLDVLICSDTEEIHRAASELADGEVSVEAVQADLATHEGCEQLLESVRALGRPVDALLLNAGIGVGGEFLATNLDDELRAIGLNCAAVVHLAKGIVPQMVARGSGRVLVTASIASTAPAPYLAVYGATKAFDLSFAEALRHELLDTGVTVTALQPGPTDTDFFERADMEDTRVAQGKKDEPEDVAKVGFEAMMRGEDSVVAASLRNRMQGWANEVLPEPTKARLQGMQTEPGSARGH